MMWRRAMVLVGLVALTGMVGGCSRSYDGSVVPTYEMGTDRVAGIPYLTLKRTPLDPPNRRGVAPRPAPDLAAGGFDTRERGDVKPPAPQPRRFARRPVSRGGPPAPRKDLRCRDEAPGARLVRMVCE